MTTKQPEAEDEFPHLLPNAARAARLDDEARIAYLQKDKFVSFDRAEALLGELEFLYRLEDATRPQGRVLIGESLMGKSTIFREFLRNHRADSNVGGDAAIVPVLYLQYPDAAGEGVYAEILRSLNAAPRSTISEPRLRADCISLLDAVDCRLLIIDEIAHLLTGNVKQQQSGMNSIKFLMNERKRPIVLGATREAYTPISTDDQLKSRFRPLLLRRFKDDEEFQELLSGFEMTIPLRKPSNFASDLVLASKVYELSEGVTGNVSDLLVQAAIQAIESGEECITTEGLDKLEWLPTSLITDTVKAM